MTFVRVFAASVCLLAILGLGTWLASHVFPRPTAPASFASYLPRLTVGSRAAEAHGSPWGRIEPVSAVCRYSGTEHGSEEPPASSHP
jgi:hypothetical protein